MLSKVIFFNKFIREHCISRLVAILIATATLVISCVRWQGEAPTTKPRMTPLPISTGEPSLTGSDATETREDVCHVFIAKHEVQLGGRPALVKAIYIGQDGTIQKSSERTDDTVLSLKESKADTQEVLGSFGTLKLPEQPSEYTSPTGEPPIMLPEIAGPTLLVEVAPCNTYTKKQWVGSPEDAPHALQQLVNKANTLSQQLTSQSVILEQRFIRSQLRKPYEVEYIPSVTHITKEQLESNPLLNEAIRHERRLIRVSSDEALYYDIPLSFAHRENINIMYDQQVFQIRHLIGIAE